MVLSIKGWDIKDGDVLSIRDWGRIVDDDILSIRGWGRIMDDDVLSIKDWDRIVDDVGLRYRIRSAAATVLATFDYAPKHFQ